MKDAGRTDPDPMFPSRMRRLDDAYVRFDAEWQAGRRPRIEDYLDGLSEADRTRLLRDLLAVELEFRRGRGEGPTPEDYETRFPGQSGVIVEVFDRTASWMPAQTSSHGSVSLPEKFGRYRILRRLGGGGMGVVYLAHDSKLDRQVAMKVPLFTDADGPLVAERFLREARAAAALHHPNLCPIHDVGQIEGIFFLTMAHIEGRSLADHLRDGRPIEFRKAAILVRSLALAMAEAHRAGVIHRDLKPSNVMINRRGVPVIIDFGLARRIRKNDPRLTQSGMMLGTPAYMPPEQLQGQVAAMGPGCDIYSLGVIFYELLAGRRPFLGSVAEITGQILYATPQPPSAHRGGLDPRLDAICLKSMARSTVDRYPEMSDVAAALDDYLRDSKRTDPSRPALLSPSVLPAVDDSPASKTGRGHWRLAPFVAVVVIACVSLALAGPRLLPLFSPLVDRLKTRPQPPFEPMNKESSVTPAVASSGPAAARPGIPPAEQARPAEEPGAHDLRDDFDTTIARLTEQVRRNPLSASAWNERGSAYFDQAEILGEKGLRDQAAAEFDRAVSDYGEAVRLAPKTAEVYFNRGNALLGKGEYPRAIADYNEAIRLNPAEAGYFRNRGKAHLESAQFDKAIRDFDEAILLRPDDPVPYDGRGSAYAHKGDLERSKADYEHADRLKSR